MLITLIVIVLIFAFGAWLSESVTDEDEIAERRDYGFGYGFD